jgi:hypothetical protein
MNLHHLSSAEHILNEPPLHVSGLNYEHARNIREQGTMHKWREQRDSMPNGNLQDAPPGQDSVINGLAILIDDAPSGSATPSSASGATGARTALQPPSLPTRLLGSNAAGCPNASDGFEELEEDNETYCVINSANQILFEAKKVMICPPDAAGETFLLMQRCDNGRTLKAKCDFVVSQAEAHRRAM